MHNSLRNVKTATHKTVLMVTWGCAEKVSQTSGLFSATECKSRELKRHPIRVLAGLNKSVSLCSESLA